MDDFKNKVAFITGGNSGIGKATALAFAKEGAKVAIAARRKKEGLEVLEQIKQFNSEAIFIELDVSIPEMVKSAIEETVSKLGGLDYCFNNAGLNVDSGIPLHEFSIESWNTMVGVNLSGVFYCLKYQIPHLLKTGHGSIVNMSSVGGLISKWFVSAAYNSTKHGIIGLTKNAALAYAKYGIRVNSICPAIVKTPLTEALPEEAKEALSQMHPIGRYADVEEVAEAVLWLCSEKAGFITGSSFVMDGGLTIG
jgi:NAD(P)-dependent dehydrogenase (short-subunit alcohol dehydrogenase family)